MRAMAFKYDLKISQLLLRIESPQELQLSRCFVPFLVGTESGRKPDILLKISFGTNNIASNKDVQFLSKNVYSNKHSIIQRYFLKDDEYIYRIEPVGRGEPYRLGIPTFFADAFCTSGNLLNYLEMERLLLPFNRVILHGSAVIYKSKAYIFSSPSGGGKSTHASLWEKYFGAEIINGDKVVISVNSSGCIAYGSPVAGSSGIYRNLGAPIAAIVFLVKGERNNATVLTGNKGYFSNYSELVKSSWDKAFNCRLLELIEVIMANTPILSLECKPNQDAVRCILDQLERMVI